MESSLILIRSPHFNMNVKTLKRFCKDTSRTFFNEFGLISHQINLFHLPWESIDRHILIWMWKHWKSSVKMHHESFSMSLTWKPSDKLISSTIGVDQSPHLNMNVKTLKKFYKDASRTFFNEFGLISHQINSFNQFIWLIGCSVVESNFNRSNKRRHVTITYGKAS